MKTIITTINAKYIHTSLALSWIYQACKETCDIEYVEFAIKEPIEQMAQKLVASKPDHIGFGVYIWNVAMTKQLIERVRMLHPSVIVTLGGPEVTYEPSFFIEQWPVEYVVCGEGEFVFRDLCHHLKEGTDIDFTSIATRDKPHALPARASIEALEQLDSPYFEGSLDMTKRVTYFETSRGCPYRCSYCLSSLEKGVRYFSQSWIEQQLKYLFNQKAHTIKLLDRTFNLNHDHTMFVFELMKQYDNNTTVCQFEIYADLLKPKMLDYLSTFRKNFFRFEIGIQSTDDTTNRAVDRLQDFQLIRSNIIRLMADDVIDLHLDLIAGLPYETKERFIQSFNDVFSLKPHELQLGFLKMLRGTKLRQQALLLGYEFDEQAPYQIISNQWLSRLDLDDIHLVEEMLDRFYNAKRFSHVFDVLLRNEFDYFDWFLKLGYAFLKHQSSFIGYQLDDLFKIMVVYLNPKDELLEALMIDYYAHFKVKPKRFMEATVTLEEKKQLIEVLSMETDWLINNHLSKMMLHKYSCFEKVGKDRYLIITYQNFSCSIAYFQLP